MLANDPKRKKYTAWDLKLVRAYHDREHWNVNGYPIWVEESKSVEFVGKSKVIRSKEAVDIAERAYHKRLEVKNGPSKPTRPGITFYPEMRVRAGHSYPRFEDWAKERANAQPTADDTRSEKLRRRQEEAEERARAKLAELEGGA